MSVLQNFKMQLQDLKTKAASGELLKGIDAGTKLKYCGIGLIFSFISLMISIIGVVPTLFLGLAMCCIAGILLTVYQKGPMNYLSPTAKRILLQRSIFDILCDIWFIPTITLYISAIIKPFLYNITPMQAKKMIEDLPHDGIKQAIFKKGLVNILPEKVSKTLKNNVEDGGKPSEAIKVLEVVSNSGSTKSDDLAKLHHKDELLSLEGSELESVNRFTIQNNSMHKAQPEFLKIQSGGDRFVKKGNNEITSKTNFVTKVDDVRGNLETFAKPTTQHFVIEEEKFEHIPKREPLHLDRIHQTAAEVKNNVREDVDVDTFDIIPIKSSSKFHKENNMKAYEDFLSLVNVRTKILDSNRKNLIGKTRPIFSEKQLGRINCLIKQQSINSPQIKALVQPNRISEEDVFWDNFWLFKKKEEEKRMKRDNQNDSDEEHKLPMKLGDYMKNPQVVVQLLMNKNIKKLKRNLIFINSIGGLSLMTLLFIIQLRYSPRFRKYSKILIHLSLFAFTIIGFGGSVALLYKGLKSKLSKKKVENNENYDIKNEELPELTSETIFKKKLY